MGCSCGSGRRHVDEAEFRRVGLQIRHAYSLLDVKEYNNQRYVLHLFFPEFKISIVIMNCANVIFKIS